MLCLPGAAAHSVWQSWAGPGSSKRPGCQAEDFALAAVKGSLRRPAQRAGPFLAIERKN